MTTAFEKKFIEVHLRADLSPSSSNESDSDSYFSFRKPSMTFASTAAAAAPPEGFELKLVNLSNKYRGGPIRLTHSQMISSMFQKKCYIF